MTLIKTKTDKDQRSMDQHLFIIERNRSIPQERLKLTKALIVATEFKINLIEINKFSIKKEKD